MEINPFKPGSPVPPGVFAGRTKEVELIHKAIAQTGSFSPQNVIITGERGIGKTSVALLAKAIASKMMPNYDHFKHPLITVYVSVKKNTHPATVLTQIVEELETVLEPNKKLIAKSVDTIKSFLSKFKSISVKGVAIEATQERDSTLEEVFFEAKKLLREIANDCYIQEKGEERAICIIVDELDQMREFENFSLFWKTLQETLVADGASNLMLIFVGMPEVMSYLNDDHESFLRTCTPINLDRMNEEDAKGVIQKVLSKTEKKIDINAMEKILYYSERFPHLIQEIGYTSFEASKGKQSISLDEVEKGVHGTNEVKGSIERLGELFFSRMYDEVKKSENFKEILKIVAEKSGSNHDWVNRQYIMEKFALKKTSLDSAIKALKDKNILIKNPDKDGEYRMFSKMFQVYISKMFK